MFFFINIALGTEPTATLLVSPDGGYILDISMKDEWDSAELFIDQPVGRITQNNFHRLHFEGAFDIIPKSLNIRMNLAKEDEGAFFNTYISPIYLPYSPPSLTGTHVKPLKEYSLSWKIYRFFYNNLSPND